MERLRQKDKAEGITRAVVSEAQKAAIAEVRTIYEAKLAQLEVLYQGRVQSMLEPADREALDEEYRRDRERVTAERDRKVEAARAS
jgi:hypothetical protein